ncbi:substrate-binding domain-containing protein [Williamsia deligens]|uniref:Substrate-binding domain-containing protein n=1 Tax=Williamsia deligens TaxID=321325 RepID=A0ABW3G8Y1_9NOCA|nr:substrate-binding domain-containing protein [Williamsia deligens]MCP2192696.1 amino acid/amide ABC transporter substrate-binding protein, HAAT family (TC 3.A.1.4.-) [Williamsia deligens]
MRLGVVIPRSGPSGIFGPSCAAGTQLAVDELNARDGILGEPVEVTTIDGGAAPDVVATAVAGLRRQGAVDAVVGWHNSAVRRALVAAAAPVVPYVYTATYEGGEADDAVFLTGETPDRHVIPAMRWMGEEHGVRRWAVVGSDYVWPRTTARHIAAAVREMPGTEIAATAFAPLGCRDVAPILDSIERADVDGVVVMLLGSDAVLFNRAFARRGLSDRCVRLGPLMDENMLLATGAAATRGVYSTAGFYESLVTAPCLDLGGRYARRFGTTAPPLTSPGESCFEGVQLLAELARRAGSLDVPSMNRAAADGFRYGSPRGDVVFDGRHLAQDVYVAVADALDFDVVARISAVA